MQIYNYNAVTGEYAGISQADQSPLNSEEWLIPANATDIAPPNTGEKEVAVFVNNTEWHIEEDHRGLKYWTPDGEEHEVKEIGSIPSDVLFLERPSENHFAENGEWVYNEQKHREEWRETAFLERAEFAKKVAEKEWLSNEEAEKWAAGLEIPNIVGLAINNAPEVRQLSYRIDTRSRKNIGRMDTLIEALATMLNVSDTELDDAFGFKPFE
jgi:hypothetical protein